MDPILREEAVQRHRRIAFLSDLLRITHKHTAYLSGPSMQYDSTARKIEELANSMKSARNVSRQVYEEKRRDTEKREARLRIQTLMKTLTGRESEPYIEFRMGKASAERYKNHRTISYRITVGWMWNHKVWGQLYAACNTDYGHHLILRAERVRVNQRWIELFEVLVYHPASDTVRNGYVARTKTPKQNTAFHPNASTAVAKAQSMMVKEMNLAGEQNAGSEED